MTRLGFLLAAAYAVVAVAVYVVRARRRAERAVVAAV
jgi:hypothetical protein